MRAGALDHRLTIQVLSVGQDSHGGVTSSWNDLATVWGQLVSLGGKERLVAAQTTAEEYFMFRIRYLSGFDTKARIVWEGVAYDIQSIKRIGRRSGLEIMVKRP